MLLPLTFVITITIFTFIILPFSLNYLILYNNISYGFIILFFINFIISFFIGYFISYYTGKTKCENSINKVSLCKGLKQAFFSTLVYVIIFFIPFFKSGFIDLFGDTFLINSLAESFILVLTNIALTIDNYFLSINQQCKLDFELSAAAWKKIEKKLNSRKKKRDIEKIQIKA